MMKFLLALFLLSYVPAAKGGKHIRFCCLLKLAHPKLIMIFSFQSTNDHIDLIKLVS